MFGNYNHIIQHDNQKYLLICCFQCFYASLAYNVILHARIDNLEFMQYQRNKTKSGCMHKHLHCSWRLINQQIINEIVNWAYSSSSFDFMSPLVISLCFILHCFFFSFYFGNVSQMFFLLTFHFVMDQHSVQGFSFGVWFFFLQISTFT